MKELRCPNCLSKLDTNEQYQYYICKNKECQLYSQKMIEAYIKSINKEKD